MPEDVSLTLIGVRSTVIMPEEKPVLRGQQLVTIPAGTVVTLNGERFILLGAERVWVAAKNIEALEVVHA